MKRLSFESADELISYCREHEIELTVEYQDENGRQRQVVLQQDTLDDLADFFEKPKTTAYFKQEKIFYEVVAQWVRT